LRLFLDERDACEEEKEAKSEKTREKGRKPKLNHPTVREKCEKCEKKKKKKKTPDPDVDARHIL
jgi:hypothetical protein